MTDEPVFWLSPKRDFVFKRLLGDPREVEGLADFLQSILSFPPEEYEEVTIVDPHMHRRHPDDKECILDVRVKTRSGHVVNVEVQVGAVPGMMRRMQFYAARLMAEQVKKGDDYTVMPRVVCIAVLDHRLIEEDERYHHCFRLYDPEAGLAYPDSVEIHTLELRKLPSSSDGSALWTWMRFLSSKTSTEFAAAKERSPIMAKMVARLAELSADEAERMLAEARDKAEHDQIARERHALRKGRAEGKAEGEETALRKVALRLLRTGLPKAEIAEATSLSLAEIERLAEE